MTDFDYAQHEVDSMKAFRDELETIINRYSRENGSDTPDFILADYLVWCLQNYNTAVQRREGWYGRKPKGYATLEEAAAAEEAK